MNLTNVILVALCSLMILSGCKKEEEPTLDFPITYEYDGYRSEHGIRAFIKQGNTVVETDATPYLQDQEFDMEDYDHPDKIVLISETSAMLHYGNEVEKAELILAGQEMQLKFTDNAGACTWYEGIRTSTSFGLKSGVQKVVEAGNVVSFHGGSCNYCDSNTTYDECYAENTVIDIFYNNIIEQNQTLVSIFFEFDYKKIE